MACFHTVTEASRNSSKAEEAVVIIGWILGQRDLILFLTASLNLFHTMCWVGGGCRRWGTEASSQPFWAGACLGSNWDQMTGSEGNPCHSWGLPSKQKPKDSGTFFFSFEDNCPDSCNMISKLQDLRNSVYATSLHLRI